jgi:hypothetical protein
MSTQYHYADHVITREVNDRGFIYRANGDGLESIPLHDVLRHRTLYRGCQQDRQDALEALAGGDLYFAIHLHDIPHVDGHCVASTFDWNDAIQQAVALSSEGADVTINACARGWGFPECDLGLWSRGRLVRQSHHIAV